MPHLEIERVLPYRPEALFDIAADVEAYPDYLPGWRAATIRLRDGNVLTTDQTIGFGPVTQRFTTLAILERPHELAVTAVDGPFEAFRMVWRFRQLPDNWCRVALDARIELRTRLAGRVFERSFGLAAATVLVAFEERARRLHGPRRRPGSA